MVVYVMQKIGGNKNSPKYPNIMVSYHYHDENGVIKQYFPSTIVDIP